TLVLRNEAVMSGGSYFWQFMKQHDITVMSLPTAFWHMLCNDLDKAQLSGLSALRLVILGGEAMSLTMLKRWQGKASSDIKLFNTYGPTEGTVIATAFDATDWQAQNSLPIGQALSNTHTLVLDENQQLCPTGVHGELHIGGQGLARGYLNQPQLTAERFIQNPFLLGAGEGEGNDNDDRLYKTGDVVRTLADGNLEFIGRIDDQVKIRGFRVELGEIEHQLSQLAQIGEAVVLIREEQLVAYLTCHGPIETENLREHLHEILPEYMVPAFFVVLDELPLTANGKVDKAALPAPDAVQVANQDETPVTATQIKLAELWAKLLRIEVEELSNTSNFFKTGGHSLLAIRLVGELRAGFEVELMVKDIFDSPELAALAALIDQSLDKDTRPQVVALKRTSNRLPTSFAQQRLWFINRMDGSSIQYNMPLAMRFKGKFEHKLVAQAFERIVERHEPLRTVFVETEQGVEQFIRDDVKFELTVLEAKQSDVNRLAVEDATKPFDLAQDLMLRSSFIKLTENEGVLLFNMHHIASDGWSIGLLVNEFWSQYKALAAGSSNPFAPLPVQYADYAQWQRTYLEGEVLDAQLSYWDKQLADMPQVHSLPLDRPRPSELTFNGAKFATLVSKPTLDGLNQLALSQNATLFMVLHGAFSVLLARHSNNSDIVLGVPMANRLQKELEDIIGFFVNTLVLRTDCIDNPSFVDYLAHIKQVNLDAQANQDVPFEHLVERLKPTRSTSHSALFQILFTMNTAANTNTSEGQEDALALDDLQLSVIQDDQQVI
ncbi:MAG: AMP-binding protein, partial [Algicola sp.]|nr:AMP-binding protein [Algicola sp.]